MRAEKHSNPLNYCALPLSFIIVFICIATAIQASFAVEPTPYADGRPQAKWRMNATDAGVVIRHGNGPADCDIYGAREAIVFEHENVYYLHFDGAGPTGWLACLAISHDLQQWEHFGPVLDLGPTGSNDSAAAASPWVYNDGNKWHMFYLGTPNVSPPPERVPGFPYLTLKATSNSPRGPWRKQYDVVPFNTKSNSYYSATASPGHVVKQDDEYLMFFSASTPYPGVKRTLGIARTKDLDSNWTIDEQPILPLEEQIENSSLYHESTTDVWYLFTNHIGINEQGQEYTDAIWVYWTKDLEKWNPDDKAIVLDGMNCSWSKRCIGMPSVVPVGDRLAIFYDAPGGESLGPMHRDIGLAWLDLPLSRPNNISQK